MAVHDPRAGEITGHRRLRQFVETNRDWMAGHHVRTGTVAAFHHGDRAVLELLGHLVVAGPPGVGSACRTAWSPTT